MYNSDFYIKENFVFKVLGMFWEDSFRVEWLGSMCKVWVCFLVLGEKNK